MLGSPDFGAINLNGRLFAPPGLSSFSLREISTTDFSYLQTQFTLSGLSGAWSVLYEEGGTLYAKGTATNTVRAYSAAGTANKTSDTSKEIIITNNHDRVKCMFGDADYFYFGRVGAISGSTYPLRFDAYSKTTRLRDTGGDFSLDINYRSSSTFWMGATIRDSIVFLPIGIQGRMIALVKAV